MVCDDRLVGDLERGDDEAGPVLPRAAADQRGKGALVGQQCQRVDDSLTDVLRAR